MTEELILKTEKRERTGTRHTRRQRETGKLPAIIYGHKTDPVAVLLNYHDLALEIQHHHRLLTVELNGKQEKVLIKDVQHNYLGDKILHVDLTRVRLDERVQVNVILDLRGTPVGAADGGVLDNLLPAVELECLVTNIPENIRVPVSHMNIGDTLLARDLQLPDGTTLITAPDTPVASVSVIAEEVEEEEAVVGEAEAEPEVIGAGEKEETEEQPEEKKS